MRSLRFQRIDRRYRRAWGLFFDVTCATNQLVKFRATFEEAPDIALRILQDKLKKDGSLKLFSATLITGMGTCARRTYILQLKGTLKGPVMGPGSDYVWHDGSSRILQVKSGSAAFVSPLEYDAWYAEFKRKRGRRS